MNAKMKKYKNKINNEQKYKNISTNGRREL